MKKKLITFSLIIAAIGLIFLGFYSYGWVHTDSDSAKNTLSLNNYTEVETNGYDWWGNDDNYFYNTRFKAKAPNGKPCKGTVTKGFWRKGSTIRLD